MVLGKLDFHMQKWEIEPLHEPHPKNQPIKDLNVRTKTIIFLKRT
jgi:hypothetical protein